MAWKSIVCAGLMASVVALPVAAHNGVDHGDGVAVHSDAGDVPFTPAALPPNIADLGGPFALTDHFGNAVTDKTFAGDHMLVFFGYTNCQVMCSISLKRIGDALAILSDDPEVNLDGLNPLVITVDPVNDTPAVMQESLSHYHVALTGLTGSLEQLTPVYQAYGQKPDVLDVELGGTSVVQHSSYFFLMGPDGSLRTLFPPVLNASSMAALLKKYLLS